MYKLLILDDEPLVLAGIRSMIQSSVPDVEICGAASNGQAGWELMMRERPDIVLTDIKMPVMTGLELLKKTRGYYNNNNYPAFILLTSYEDFQMAKEAIAYHTVDYLIKLELTAETLKAAILKAVEDMVSHNALPVREPVLSVRDIQSLKDKFFIRLLHGLYDSPEQFELLRHDMDIPFPAGGYQCCYFEMNNAEVDTMALERQVTYYASVYEMLQKISEHYFKAYFVNLDRKHGAVIILPEDGEAHAQDTLRQQFWQIGTTLFQYYKTGFNCGIGTIVSEPLALADSYQSARQVLAGYGMRAGHGAMAGNGSAAEYGGAAGNDTAAEHRATANNIVAVYDIDVINTDAINKNSHSIFNISIFKEDLNSAFAEYDSALLKKVLGQIISLFEGFEENPNYFIQSLDAACNILFLSISLLPDGESVISSLFSDNINGYRSVYSMKTTGQIMQWIGQFSDRLGIYFDEQKKGHRHHVVEQVKKYIETHLSDKLTLNNVSAVYGISPNYLSALFKKYNDCGFSEYITERKIAQAKKMMNEGNKKVYEIADILGFESAFYFSKVFKKLVGVSPSEYSRNGNDF